MMIKQVLLFVICFYLYLPCNAQTNNTSTTIHVFVALCDNKNQGIVPVPGKMGNGQDPANNLYWGAAYGVKSSFTKSKEWQFLSSVKPGGMILERLIFKHRVKDYYLVADAYDGKYIRECTIDFLNSCAGKTKESITTNNTTIGIGGNAKLIGYIGHNGLIDFRLPYSFTVADEKQRQAIVLSCISKEYFKPYLFQAKTLPLLWTMGLMAPEAYILHDALSGFINNENGESIRLRAAKAYSKYQKCSVKAAQGILVTGW